ncbi:MAG: D-alanyl-D-alanine carboxypeptidase, partial [Desulfobulbales bacterium]|nr:D-alanyl-D-alanine carboxypeptidase [Desulfobulbales bacterium]
KSVTGTVVSAEGQTPTLPVMARLAENLEPGNHRININQEESSGIENSSRYVGELFRVYAKRENIAGAGKISLRQIPENLAPFYIHHSSKTLAEMIGPLMLYSNNFIANQLFLVLGAHEAGFPATWEKSTQAMADYLQQKHKLSQNEIKIIEGSGLSRKNRVSPHAMIRLLDSFRPYAEFLPRENSRLLKSGTLQGVYTFGGYFMENQSLDSFVLLLNQGQNNRDRVLAELEKIYRAH